MTKEILRASAFVSCLSFGWFGCSSSEDSQGGGAQNQAGAGFSAGGGAATAGASGSGFGAGGVSTAAGGSSVSAGGTVTGSAGAPAAGGSAPGTGGSAPGTGGSGTSAEEGGVGAGGDAVGTGDAGEETGGSDAGPLPEPDASTGAPGQTCLKGTGDFVMDGPYDVSRKTVTIGSKGQFTIFYPDPLETDCPHPIVAWGNGTLITGGTAYDHFLNHAGSWGIVSIASHNSNVGDGSFHKAAIDYLLEQNEDSSSEFFGKLSTLAGVTGHSQGGAGGDRASDHPNVKANVNVQGSFGSPPMSTAALLCLTGTQDISPDGCPRAVRAAQVPAMSASWAGADHVATTLLEGEGIEQYQRLFSAWFRCFLADDQTACALFKGGENCQVCQERGWEEIFSNNY